MSGQKMDKHNVRRKNRNIKNEYEKNRKRENVSSPKSMTERNTDRAGQEKICPVAQKCGGCKWINKPYEEQLKLKEKRILFIGK